MPKKTIYSIVIAAALSPLFCQDFFPSAYPFSGSDIVWQPGTRERASEQTYVEVHHTLAQPLVSHLACQSLSFFIWEDICFYNLTGFLQALNEILFGKVFSM